MRRSIAAIFIASATTSAWAHHSYARIDRGSIVAFEGTITEFNWRSPHVYLRVETTDAKGSPVAWDIETRSTPVLTRSGWTRDSLRPGDVVSIRAHPERGSNRNYALLASLEKSDGTRLNLSPRESESDASAPDLNGVWTARSGLARELADLHLTEKGLAARANYNPETDNPGTQCIGSTTPATLGSPLYLNRIEVGTDTVFIRNEFFDAERAVHMQTGAHPEHGQRSLHGHSIGWWEEETLVVDTSLFADHRSPYGMTSGVPSGAQKHVVEKYRLSPDGRHLTIDVFLEDPEYLAEPLEATVEWDYTPDSGFYGYNCDLDVAQKSTPR